MGLSDKADARVKTLSGGQQRRLDVVARHHRLTRLLFLDEPTTGFDPSARRRRGGSSSEKLRGEGTTIILTTHYMDEAQHLADRVVVMNHGEIVASGTPDTIGGRSRAAVRIRFALTDGGAASSLPLAADRDGAGLVRHRDERRGASAAHLDVWALDNAIDLVGLTVDRPSLEDVYLEAHLGGGGGMNAGSRCRRIKLRYRRKSYWRNPAVRGRSRSPFPLHLPA